MIAENLRDLDAGLALLHVGAAGRIDSESDLPREGVGPAKVDPHRAVALVDPSDFAVEGAHLALLSVSSMISFASSLVSSSFLTRLGGRLQLFVDLGDRLVERFAGVLQVGLELGFLPGDPIPLAVELGLLAGPVLFGLGGTLLELLHLAGLWPPRDFLYSSFSLGTLALASSNSAFRSLIVLDIFSSRG